MRNQIGSTWHFLTNWNWHRIQSVTARPVAEVLVRGLTGEVARKQRWEDFGFGSVRMVGYTSPTFLRNLNSTPNDDPESNVRMGC